MGLPRKSQFAAICILIAAGHVASAETWQIVDTIKNGLGEDGRVVEIDANSVKRGKEELSVRVRETTQSTGASVGYSCREGDIRHGKTDKKITALLCDRPSAPNPYGPHERNWITIEERKTPTSEYQRRIDLNSLSRRDYMAMVHEGDFGVRTTTWHFDCRGYYRTGGVKEWTLIDLTDKIATVPRGFVSPERKVANMLCAPAMP